MYIGQILEVKKNGNPLIVIEPECSVQEAASILCEYKIGSLPVTKSPEGNLVGILTERDILQQCQEDGKDLDEIKVESIMTRDPVTISAKCHVHEALKIMTPQHIRHLPVVDDGSVLGIISIGDILKAIVEEDEQRIHELSEYLGGTYANNVY